MRLAEALRLDETPRLALVGAGGKTRTLFQLGHEYSKILDAKAGAGRTVILTATTHLATHQLAYADRHVFIRDLDDLEIAFKNMATGTILLTGLEGEDGRTAGLSGEVLDGIYKLAQARNLPLFIEADGSRQRPLKAPAAHEPVIPDWVNEVVVVAGMSAVGKTLEPEWVHRPERFAVLSGLPAGDEIHTDAIAKVLRHKDGGLKSIPSQARRTVLLNQAATHKSQAAAHRLAKQLLADYHAVVVANLPSSSAPTELETAIHQNKFARPILAVHEPIAGVILAAGGASRFGSPKQVINWRGMPLVRYVAICALGAGLSPLVVVSGHAADLVDKALVDLPVRIVYNPDWQAGQSTSLSAGVSVLQEQVGGVVFILVDQPFISRGLIRTLVEEHAESLAPVIGPVLDDRRGNPVLFDRSTFSDLRRLSGDIGGRALFSRYPVRWLQWYDQDAGLDIDTPQDYWDLQAIS